MEELKLLCVVSGISCYEYAGGRNNLWGMWMEGSHVTRAWEEVSRSYPWFSQIQNQRASREGKYFWQKQTKEQRGSNTAFPWSKRRKSRKAIFSARMTKSSFLVRETFYNFLTRDTLAYIQSSFISIVFSLIFMHCGNNCALFNWAKTKLDKDYESYLYSIYLNAWVYVICQPPFPGEEKWDSFWLLCQGKVSSFLPFIPVVFQLYSFLPSRSHCLCLHQTFFSWIPHHSYFIHLWTIPQIELTQK